MLDFGGAVHRAAAGRELRRVPARGAEDCGRTRSCWSRATASAVPGYIPIERAWKENDGNLSDWCWVNPGSEKRMTEASRESTFGEVIAQDRTS